MENIKITLETLYDILRNEKKKEDLQKLEETFFLDVVSYLREKKAFLELKKDNDNPFATGEKEKLEYELRSIQRILKEIYEKREKKIIDIALNRSRTGSDIIDTSSMLREEREFYQKILEILDQFRRGVALNLLRGNLPEIVVGTRIELRSSISSVTQPSSFSKFEGAPAMVADDEDESPPISNTDHQIETTETPAEIPLEMTKIKIIRPIPKFVWKDLKVYGPFDSGEETSIFPEVAELMIRKGRAEKV